MQKQEQEDGEWLSALADGQLEGDEFAQALARLGASDAALSTWHAYHVAGDVLRCPDLADCSRDRAFAARLRSRLVLSQESLPGAMAAMPNGHLLEGAAAANDAVVRWKWLAAAASVAALAVSVWHVSQTAGMPAGQLASGKTGDGAAVASVAPASTGEPPVMLRDPRLDELLAAHRQFGGTSALQMPAGFLRNATFEQTGR